MNKQQYEKWMNYWKTHPDRSRAVLFLDAQLTFCFVFAYAALLYLSYGSEKFVPLLAVPGVAFLLLSGLRAWINGPRPSEVYGIPASVVRHQTGHSFPSRHAFSAFMIAFSAFHAGYFYFGLILTVLAVLVVFLRIILGLHFVADVCAGALSAAAAALIGFVLIF